MLATFKMALLTPIVVHFILRQIRKFREDTDWELIKIDLEPRVRDLMPGEWFDDEAVRFVKALLDAVVYVLSAEQHLKDTINDLVNNRWFGAIRRIKRLLKDYFFGPENATQELKACLRYL